MRGEKTIAAIYATGKVPSMNPLGGFGVWNEGPDGWWAALLPGWEMDPGSQVHVCHEYTLSELLRAVRRATRCRPGCSCGV